MNLILLIITLTLMVVFLYQWAKYDSWWNRWQYRKSKEFLRKLREDAGSNYSENSIPFKDWTKDKIKDLQNVIKTYEDAGIK